MLRQVDATRRNIIHLRQRAVDEALVVPEVEVGLRAVVGDVHLAVLERRHGARIDVDVGIELLDGHAEAALHQHPTERGGRDALAERRDDATGHEDVLRRAHGLTSFRCRVKRASAYRRSSAVSTPGAAGPAHNATPIGRPCNKGRSCSSRAHRSSGTGGSRTHRSSASRVYAYTPTCW